MEIAWVVGVAVMAAVAAAAPSGVEQCTDQLNKVTDCLDYATARSAAPTKQCCASVASIRSSSPKCLCYFVIQAHNGSAAIKSLGIQEARLLQLPTACKLANASLSECPKLLGIPPGSPSYLVFSKNASSSATPAGANSSTSSPAAAGNSGAASGRWPHLSAAALGVAAALLFSFPVLPAIVEGFGLIL